jgi:hypothetical protein
MNSGVFLVLTVHKVAAAAKLAITARAPRLSRHPSGKHRTPPRECVPGRGRDPEAAASLQRTLLVCVPRWLCRSHSLSELAHFRCLLFDIRQLRQSCTADAFRELVVSLDAFVTAAPPFRGSNCYPTKNIGTSEAVQISANRDECA